MFLRKLIIAYQTIRCYNTENQSMIIIICMGTSSVKHECYHKKQEVLGRTNRHDMDRIENEKNMGDTDTEPAR
jgi:hypothetical protein